ncbi:MAG: hypothetical protein AB1801_16630 [Chloroflexota bacterium]
MKNLRQWAAKFPKLLRILPIVLVTLGLAITIYFGLRAVNSFRQLQYIHEQGLDRGAASVDAIRPWMTIPFIAVAYAVPEEYLYSQLEIPFDRHNFHISLGELNRNHQLGQSPNGDYPAIIDKVRAAITAYRANPVVTGLRDVRTWMSIHYIANSTGVPADYIFKQLNLPMTGNEDKPLDILSEELHYKGGPLGLADDIQRVLAGYQETP